MNDEMEVFAYSNSNPPNYESDSRSQDKNDEDSTSQSFSKKAMDESMLKDVPISRIDALVRRLSQEPKTLRPSSNASTSSNTHPDRSEDGNNNTVYMSPDYPTSIPDENDDVKKPKKQKRNFFKEDDKNLEATKQQSASNAKESVSESLIDQIDRLEREKDLAKLNTRGSSLGTSSSITNPSLTNSTSLMLNSATNSQSNSLSTSQRLKRKLNVITPSSGHDEAETLANSPPTKRSKTKHDDTPHSSNSNSNSKSNSHHNIFSNKASLLDSIEVQKAIEIATNEANRKISQLVQEIQEKDNLLKMYETSVRQKEDLVKQKEDLLRMKDLNMREAEVAAREMEHQFREHVASQMKTILCEAERNNRAALREKLSQETVRLGYVSYGRTGEEYKEGTASKALREKEKKLEQTREAYEATKKRLSKRKTALTAILNSASSTNKAEAIINESASGKDNSSSSPLSPYQNTPASPQTFTSSHHFGNQMSAEKELEDILMQEQLIKLRLQTMKVDEAELVREKDVLRTESILHWKELRRFQEEESSKFNNFPVLDGRYLMLQLLGRGGFSEVYRAYDLVEFKTVACKIHQLSPEWSQEKKMNYLRHAQRECDIHKALVHPRVVSLYAIFEIDKDSFCTVLQYCPGGDLDSHLKQHKSLSETESRVLIAQLFDGLKYLATRGQKIIHYDLKPGNILFDENGGVKIADFGLSKIMEENTELMELTSQGAGTYWYLPPECFDRDKPQISSKVDVWSAGVILYQMLYGCKPFGNNISQKVIMERNIIHSNLQVDFPASKKISDEAKAFLQKCLTPNVNQRPDVVELSSDPFLSFVPVKKSNSGLTARGFMPPPSGPAKPAVLTTSGTITTTGGGTLTITKR